VHELSAPAAELTVADVTKLLAAVKKRESETKKRQRELDDEELSSVAHLSKQLKVAKAERKQIKLERQKELAKAQAEVKGATTTDGEDWPEIGDGRRKPKAKPTSLDYWQLGNKCARLRKDGMVADAICEDLPAVWCRLQSHGWAIKKNMKNLFTADCQPSQEQADYILKTNLDNKFVIFDNAVWSDTSSSISLEEKTERIGARMQLKAANHSGKWQKVFLDYTKKYNKQLECIIQGMFVDGEAGNPSNWIMKNNSIVGGTNYQHPHCDSGRAGRYQNLQMFPFVTLHGFGTYPFALWILPEGYEYGFLHTFDADDILFLRGDMIHAGVPSLQPRGHMEFYPLHAAGWLRRNPFWAKTGDKNTTFPWQLPTFPFGYPEIGTPDEKGTQIISYPVHLTQALQIPLPNDPVVVPKKVRLAAKKRCAAQLHLL
jgi:hypothetical protein